MLPTPHAWPSSEADVSAVTICLILPRLLAVPRAHRPPHHIESCRRCLRSDRVSWPASFARHAAAARADRRAIGRSRIRCEFFAPGYRSRRPGRHHRPPGGAFRVSMLVLPVKEQSRRAPAPRTPGFRSGRCGGCRPPTLTAQRPKPSSRRWTVAEPALWGQLNWQIARAAHQAARKPPRWVSSALQ